MRGDETFHAAPAIAVRRDGPAGQHDFENLQQSFGDIEIILVTGLMEGDQDLVGQASAIARRAIGAVIPRPFIISVRHTGSCS